MPRTIFIDASFWIAYRDSRDQMNARAASLLHQMFRDRSLFLTTLPVFCEIHARFSRLPRHRQAVIADFWKNPAARVELPTHEDTRTVTELLDQHSDKSFSYCDALSFVIMRRLNLRQAASFDIHFRQFGEFEIIG